MVDKKSVGLLSEILICWSSTNNPQKCREADDGGRLEIRVREHETEESGTKPKVKEEEEETHVAQNWVCSALKTQQVIYPSILVCLSAVLKEM